MIIFFNLETGEEREKEKGPYDVIDVNVFHRNLKRFHCIFHSFSYAGWLPCAKYDCGCGSRKFSTLSRKTGGRRKAEKTKKDAGQGKKQESTRWILPSFCACSAAPTISTFRNYFIIMLSIWPVCKSDLFHLPEGESTEA